MSIKNEEIRDFVSRGLHPLSLLDVLVEGKSLSESVQAILERGYDPKYARRLLERYTGRRAHVVLKEFLDHYKELLRLAEIVERKLGLDPNWITSVICFCVQDSLVRKKAGELGIQTQRRDDRTGEYRFKNSKVLFEEVGRRLETTGNQSSASWMRIAQAFNEEDRNTVVHEGGSVEPSRAEMILTLTNQLVNNLAKSEATS